jgi:hypothetical protein
MKYIKKFEYGIRDEYARIGVENFYKTNKDTYVNPHLNNVQKCLDWVLTKINITDFIDLACGNGEVSSFLDKKGITDSIGIDPYLCNTYNKKTNNECLNLSFEDISTNGLDISKQTIICSYALHLCQKSYLNNLLYNLSTNCEYFILISPSKYPIIENDYFELMFSTIINKTHCKIFKSVLK